MRVLHERLIVGESVQALHDVNSTGGAAGTAHQKGSLRAGPVGKCARFSPMLCVNLPNSDAPPKADTPMLEGMNHLPQMCHAS